MLMSLKDRSVDDMTNWFIQDRKVLTVDGKIKGCCCQAVWQQVTLQDQWGAIKWKRSGGYMPAGTFYFRAYIQSATHYKRVHACGEQSAPEFVGYTTAVYSIFVPEDCDEIYSGPPPNPNLHTDSIALMGTYPRWWWEPL